jgi:hypothetical protein
MAEAQLNFDEDSLDQSTGLYDLYSRFYEGMRTANLVDAPDYATNPPTTGNGEIDTAAIAQGLAEYSTILMKNSAYMMANAIMTVVSGGGEGGTSGIGFLSRSGDSMTGQLGALYGFQAGYGNNLIFDVTINAYEENTAHVYGQLLVDNNLTVDGQLHVSDEGVYFSKTQTIYYADDTLKIDSENMLFTGDVEVDGSLSIGDILINGDGLFNGDQEFYHSGNSNNEEVDWSMRNAYVYGDLYVYGDQELNGFLSALYGFELGVGEKKLFYSIENEETGLGSLHMATDLSISTGYGIKFNENYIIRVRGGADSIVSFSAPGMVMNLGDSDGESQTSRIALQTGIYNHNSDYCMISQYGDGNFKNSLSAGCANSGPTVLRTYYLAADNCGVIFYKKLRLGGVDGASFYSDNTQAVIMTVPYQHVISGGSNQTDHIPVSFSYKQTDSLFKDQSKIWSASLYMNTEAEFFSFGKPVEGGSFSIISEVYKTRLIENTLFFDDGKFLEGVTDGIRHTGNAYFANNLSSMSFASGFAGYGWAINESELYGGIAATFDELTVRKKMRIYELEVQKQSITNGSLWVSDACSGDIVEEVA